MSVDNEIVERFKERFAALAGEAFFSMVVDGYAHWIERYFDSCDGEWEESQARKIEYELLVDANKRGIEIPGGWCQECETRRADLLHDGGTCGACEDKERQYKEDRECRRPQSKESEAVMRLYIGGLIARSVQ